jgi:hypothetical protein
MVRWFARSGLLRTDDARDMLGWDAVAQPESEYLFDQQVQR